MWRDVGARNVWGRERERLLGVLERERDFREQICTFQQLKREKQRAPLIFGWREKRRER